LACKIRLHQYYYLGTGQFLPVFASFSLSLEEVILSDINLFCNTICNCDDPQTTFDGAYQTFELFRIFEQSVRKRRADRA